MDDVNEVDSIVINEAYAKAYEKKKKAEELSKLQDKYGCDVDLSDSSSSSEDEDDDAIVGSLSSVSIYLWMHLGCNST
jgi:predicted transcriptional regulator